MSVVIVEWTDEEWQKELEQLTKSEDETQNFLQQSLIAYCISGYRQLERKNLVEELTPLLGFKEVEVNFKVLEYTFPKGLLDELSLQFPLSEYGFRSILPTDTARI
ncbi:MAG: hypothetical protein WDZ88_02495 [Candidatus Paceibacterota bacterium]